MFLCSKYFNIFFHTFCLWLTLILHVLDTILPFDLPVTSLLKLFCNRFPPLAMSETILAFLDLPRDQFVESIPMEVDEETGHRGNRLTDTGKTLVTLLDCFLSSKG